MRTLIEIARTFEYDLLVENEQRTTWLIKNFGARLLEKFRADLDRIPTDALMKILNVQSVDQKMRAWVEDPASDDDLQKHLVNFLIAADPTPNKAYARWIAVRLLKGEHFEDVNEMLKQQLHFFAQAATSRRVDANIDAQKSFSQLFTTMLPFTSGDVETSGKKDRKSGRKTATEDNRVWDVDDPMRAKAKVVYDGDDYMIVCPNTFEASKYFGKNTNWCTTNDGGTYANYNDQGPLYIILRRRDGRRWQFHFPSNQFMDEADHSINLKEFIEQNQVVFNVIGEQNFATQLGRDLSLSDFSEKILKNLGPNEVGRGIKSIADLARVPQLANTTALALVAATSGRNSTDIATHFIRNLRKLEETALPDDEDDAYSVVTRQRVAVAIIERNPTFIKDVPSEYQTEEVKDACLRFWPITTDMEGIVPKPWSDKMTLTNWANRVIHMDYKLSSVPEEILEEALDQKMNSNEILMWHQGIQRPDDFTGIAHLLDARTMSLIFSRYPPSTSELFTWPQEWIDFIPRLYQQDRFAVYGHIPNQHWPAEFVKDIIPHSVFSNLPKKDNRSVFKWACANNGKLDQLPEKYATANFVSALAEKFKEWRSLAKWALGTDKGEYKNPAVIEAVKTAMMDSAKSPIPIVSHFHQEVDSPLVEGAIALGIATPDDKTDDELVGLYFKNNLLRTSENMRSRLGFSKEEEAIANVLGRVSNMTSGRLSQILRWTPRAAPIIIPLVPQENKTEQVLRGILKSSAAPAIKFEDFPLSIYRDEELVKDCVKEYNDKFPVTLIPESIRYHVDVLTALFSGTSYYHSGKDYGLRELESDKIPVEAFIHILENSSSSPFTGRNSPPAIGALHYMEQVRDKSTAPIFYSSKVARLLLEEDYRHASLKNIYSDPARREKWGEEEYFLAAGTVVPYRDIPEKFRTERVKKKAALSRENDIDYIEDVNDIPTEDLTDSLVRKMIEKGFTKHGNSWIDAKTLPRSYELKERSYTVTTFDDANVCFFFGKMGEVLNALVSNDFPHFGRSPWDHYGRKIGAFLSDDVEGLRNFVAHLLTNEWKDVSVANSHLFDNMRCYRDENHKILPVENIKREKMSGNIWAVKTNGSYHPTYFLFDGENGAMVASILLSRRNNAMSFQSGKVVSSQINLAVDLAKDIAATFTKLDITSGTSASFKETDFYTKLGIRGPGNFKWLTSLDKKVSEHDGLALWKHEHILTITADGKGVIAHGKQTKDALKLTSINPEAVGPYEKRIRTFFT